MNCGGGCENRSNNQRCILHAAHSAAVAGAGWVFRLFWSERFPARLADCSGHGVLSAGVNLHAHIFAYLTVKIQTGHMR